MCTITYAVRPGRNINRPNIVLIKKWSEVEANNYTSLVMGMANWMVNYTIGTQLTELTISMKHMYITVRVHRSLPFPD